MISLDEARIIASNYLTSMERAGSVDLALMDDQTLEKDFGWIFFYNAKDFIKSGDYRDLLVGNAPLIVDRTNGAIHVTGTGMPVEHYVEQYRKHGTPNPGEIKGDAAEWH